MERKLGNISFCVFVHLTRYPTYRNLNPAQCKGYRRTGQRKQWGKVVFFSGSEEKWASHSCPVRPSNTRRLEREISSPEMSQICLPCHSEKRLWKILDMNDVWNLKWKINVQYSCFSNAKWLLIDDSKYELLQYSFSGIIWNAD